MSERQPFHPGHRQVSEHQLQRGEATNVYTDLNSITSPNKQPLGFPTNQFFSFLPSSMKEHSSYIQTKIVMIGLMHAKLKVYFKCV